YSPPPRLPPELRTLPPELLRLPPVLIVGDEDLLGVLKELLVLGWVVVFVLTRGVLFVLVRTRGVLFVLVRTRGVLLVFVLTRGVLASTRGVRVRTSLLERVLLGVEYVDCVLLRLVTSPLVVL